jgi:hypothetical protein
MIAIVKLLTLLLIALGAAPAAAQTLTQGSLHWYVPEHEKYGRTEFYSMPTFQSSRVYVTLTQRFKLVNASKGWALIEFDIAGKAYLHLRVLRNLAYDPAASDPWHEFQRASVFAEEPAKIAARLKAPAVKATPVDADPKPSSWKRYKDAWNLKPGRPTTAGTEESAAEPDATAPRPIAGSSTGKPRSKRPLLPPIGSEPPREAASPETPEREAETPAR